MAVPDSSREVRPKPGIGIVDSAFRAFRQFNTPEMGALARHRNRMHPANCALFSGDGFPDRVARALAEQRAISLKELLEAFEFFEQVRHRIRAPHIVDLCCGHGLAGTLFAVFERPVERVTLIDHRAPSSFEKILQALRPLAPWVGDKIEYRQLPVETVSPEVADGASVIAVHACGGRTDEALDVALATNSPLAVMPCCHRKTTPRAPRSLRRTLGVSMSADVHRTYRLIGAGYDVDWAAIPYAITPHNRIIVAHAPRADGSSNGGG